MWYLRHIREARQRAADERAVQVRMETQMSANNRNMGGRRVQTLMARASRGALGACVVEWEGRGMREEVHRDGGVEL